MIAIPRLPNAKVYHLNRLIDTDYASRIFDRPRADRFVSRLPLSWAHTGNPEFRRYQKDVIEGVKASVPIAPMDEYTLYASHTDGVVGDWDRCRYLQGYLMNPGMQPIINNWLSRDELRIPDVDSKDRARSRYIVNVYLNTIIEERLVKPQPVAIARDSTMGLPDGIKGIEAKMEAVAELLANGASIRQLIQSRDMDGLKKLNIVRCYILGSRSNQGDSFKDGKPKNRLVYSHSSDQDRIDGSNPTQFPADRAIEGENYLFRVRERMVFAMCARLNVMLSVLAEPIRIALKTRFPILFGAKDGQWLNELLERLGDVATFDAAQFDSTAPMDVLRDICEDLGSCMMRAFGASQSDADFLSDYIWKLTTAPVLARNGVKDEAGARFIGDPYDWDQELYNGIPSGIAIVTLMGTLLQVGNIITSLERHLDLVFSDQELMGLADGTHPYLALVVRSDDTGVFFKDHKGPFSHDSLKGITGTLTLLEREEFATLLGYKVHITRDGPRFFMGTSGLIQKLFLDERNADKRIKTLGVAWTAMMQVYGSAPRFEDMMAKLRSVSLDYGFDIDTTMLAGNTSSYEEGYSSEEQLLLLNPEYIHYRINPEDVRPELLKQVIRTIPAATCAKFINDFVRTK